LFISTAILTITIRADTKSRQVNLFLSLRCEELLGKEITEKLLKEFSLLNPDIQIRLQEEGEIPDIFIFDDSDFSALVAAETLAELSFFYNRDISEKSNNEFDDDDTIYFKSPLLAIPLVSFMDLLFYNIDILSAAGFFQPPKTRDEFLSCIRAVSRGNFPGISAAAFNLSPDDPQALSRDIFSWIWAAGGNFWTDDNYLPAANASTLTSAFTFFGSVNRELQTGQMLNSPGVFERTGSRQIEEFANGQLVLMFASSRFIPYLRERMGDNSFGITTIPDLGTGRRYNIGLSSIYVGINAKSSHLDDKSKNAAWYFLKFLEEKSPLFCAELKAIPGSVSNVIPGDYVKDDPFYSKAWDIFEVSWIVHGFSGKPGAHEYEAIFLEELRSFFEGNRTAMQAAAAIQRRWEEK